MRWDFIRTAVTLLALWAACRRREPGLRRRVVWGLVILSLVAFLVALGRDGFLYGLLVKVPVAGNFRYPVRYMTLLEFSLAASAAIGLAEALDPTQVRRLGRQWLLSGVAALIGLATCIGLLMRGFPRTWIQSAMHMQTGSLSALVLSLGVLIASACLVAAVWRARKWAPAISILAAAADVDTTGLTFVYSGLPPMTVAQFRASVPRPPPFSNT